MLEYLQIRLTTPEDFNIANTFRTYPANNTRDFPTSSLHISYLCYEVSEDTYMYSVSNSCFDLLLDNFEEFRLAIVLVNTGVPIHKVLEVLHGKYPVHILSS